MATGDYSMLQLMREMRKAGFVKDGGLIIGFAVSLAENGHRNLTAVYVNPDGSKDRGPWQINNVHHAEVTDECAFNLECSTREVYRISEKGSNWGAWATFASGDYKRNREWAYTVYALDEALRAKDALALENAGLSLKVLAAEDRIAALKEENASLQTQLLNTREGAAVLRAKIANAQEALA